MTSVVVDRERVELRSVISAIAGLLRNSGALTRGDVAALRRMDPRRPEAAFFKIEGLVLDEQLPGEATVRAAHETRWAAIIIGLAHLGDLHHSEDRLGFALVDAQFSEMRFARLVRADADHLVDELPALSRFLAAKGVPADWTAAAWLILSAGGANEEAIRRHLARDYYGELARKKNL